METKKYQLTEEEIRNQADTLDWHSLVRHQQLSEDFIIEFAERVDWSIIVDKQILSIERTC